ncbi:hypothetical protein Ahy_A09g045259 [Arachis hypogaea]|uniref:Auxin-induced protein n=1 Tax=Arachis hypogaea TaxID=3818 RepID=A0A445BLX6_ARAHY|nr:hypothetical protein Ahy_A09g045259 [Arachis hypogaea]
MGYLALYARDNQKHYVIPVSYLNQPSFVEIRRSPMGYLAMYVRNNQKPYVIPISYLNQLPFQELNEVEEEFGYDHPMGGLTIPL